MSALSGAFSGLLAAGIAQMDGTGGYEGWRWIFILEGLVTVCVGIGCFFLLIDTPALSSRWLRPEEIRFLELSMFIKQGGSFQAETSVKMRDLKMVLKNWRVYVQAYFLFCQSALSYGKSHLSSNLRVHADLTTKQASSSPYLPLRNP
jgi:MFS family permease